MIWKLNGNIAGTYSSGGEMGKREKLSVQAFIGGFQETGYAHTEWQHSCAGTSFLFGKTYVGVCYTTPLTIF